MHSKAKRWALIIIAVLGAIILFQIIKKVTRAGEKLSETVYDVKAVKAVRTDIRESISISGIAEGNPQIKVYSQVPGKFERNAVSEGSFVNKDDTIIYINRDIVGMDYQLANVMAPAAGIVTKIYVTDKGAFVTPQYPVAEIANPDKIKVVLSIGEEDMIKVKAGQTAEISAAYGEKKILQGSVSSVTPFIDKDTMAGTIIIRADNPERQIKPGMSVNVTIYGQHRQGIMLPENAVLLGESRSYIYINDNGRAKMADVKTGYIEGDNIEITEGIKEGDIVITEGNFKLNEGNLIKIKE
ncbi:MAG: efflux RND transporter periplasmic adaptor subunit [Candidatus Goldbacteria bacterium]|nr:efflux RND transporter periplasmic adaptor subunit [Candidatus Goldiibacteriota bacterium]